MRVWSGFKQRWQDRRDRVYNEVDSAAGAGMNRPRPRITQLDADLAKDASPQRLREPGADDTHR